MTTEQKLREALEAAQRWHKGDPWRDGNKVRRDDWEKHRKLLADALALLSAPEQQAPQGEIEALRKAQSEAVMPMIGPLLDAWEGLPNDVALDDELVRLSDQIEASPPQGGAHHTEAAKPETERAEFVACSMNGKQHDTGRVETKYGGFFASTANPEDARRIADALNAALLAAGSKVGGEYADLAKTIRDVISDIRTKFPEHYGVLHAVASALDANTRPQQQAKPLSESQWEEIASLVGCVKITSRGRAAIMRVLNAPDSGIRGKDQA